MKVEEFEWERLPNNDYKIKRNGKLVGYLEWKVMKAFSDEKPCIGRAKCPTKTGRIMFKKKYAPFSFDEEDMKEINEKIREWIDLVSKTSPRIMWHHGKCDMCGERCKMVLDFGYNKAYFDRNYRICEDCIDETNLKDRLI